MDIDFRDYLLKYGKVMEYSIQRTVEPVAYWGHCSPAQYISGYTWVDIKLKLPIVGQAKDIEGAIYKWAEGSQPNKVTLKRTPDAKHAKALKDTQKLCDKLFDEKTELENKVKDLESRLTNLIGILK